MKTGNLKPPRVAESLLKYFFKKEDRCHRLGDFEEVFQNIIQESGWLEASRWYWMQMIRSLPNLFKNSVYWSLAMFRNYLKISLRNLNKNKVYSFIKIAGVAISIAACFLIIKYVNFELSFDRFHENTDTLYRLTNDRFQDGELIQHGVITYPSLAKTMSADYPEVVNYSRLDTASRVFLKRDDIGFDEALLFADSGFLSMFSFPLLIGEAKTALSEPYSILLSESMAAKYFGDGWQQNHVLGEVLTMDNSMELSVTGVFHDIPDNTHMEFDFLVSYITLGKAYSPNMEDSWTNSNFWAYLQLAPGTDPKALEKKFIDFSENYFKGMQVTGYKEVFYLQPVKDIHLHSDYEYEAWIHGNGTVVTVLMIIAAFILIIAWVNTINLSTARSLDRAKEIGIRKVVGAQKSQIVKQFLFESTLVSAMGLLAAIGIVLFLRPMLSSLLNVQFSAPLLSSEVGIAFLVLFLTGTILSGLYPAFVTSSFQVITVLRGKISQSGNGRLVRKGLVVFQFALSFALIAGTFAVYSQLDYMLNRDLGMNIDQTMVLNGPRLTSFDSTYFDNIDNFKGELVQYPAISHVTASLRLPGRRTGRIFNVQRLSGDSERRFTTSDIGVDYDYFETFDMKILAGRGFDRSDHNMDFNAIQSAVVNESASKLLGFQQPQDAYQERIRFWGKDWEIVGVVEDHHQQSLHVPVEPIIFTPLYSSSNFFFAKVNPDNLSQTITTVKKKYQEFFPGNSFNYFFLDEFFNRQYQVDQNFRTAFSLFASLGVLLACLGLFGLSFFTTAQRTKEIGIRKVVGATTPNILVLLIKDFSKIILFAAFLSSPLTYYAITRWLAGYAYHIKFSWTLLVIPGLLTLFVALLTVSYQTIKAALINPVDPLKCE